MSIVRAYADKDTWITDSAVSANFGLSPILEVWNKYSNEKEKKEYARILIKFDLDELKEEISVNKNYPDPRDSSTVSAFIRMNNVTHGEEQASDFDIYAFPLSATWVEGRGLDNDLKTNTGYTNALYADNINLWTDLGALSGGEAYKGAFDAIYDSNSAIQSFVHGEEDLKLDVTEWFKDYLDGLSSNYGFMIRMGDKEEAQTDAEAAAAGVNTSVTGVSYFTKKFYGRETNTNRRPYLELTWPETIKDDRKTLYFSRSADLFYYNIVDGVLEDLDGTGKFPGFVTLQADGVNITPISLTAGRFSKGIYKLNIGTATDDLGNALTGVNISLSSATNFTDTWSVTSAGYESSYTFNFEPKLPSIGNDNFTTSNLIVNLVNQKSEYDYGSVANIRVFIKDKTQVLQSTTATKTFIDSFIVKNGMYEIREKSTDYVEISEQNLSYDKDGNFFEINTNNLYPNVEYKIVLKLKVRNETIIIDKPDLWNFTVL